MRQIRTALLLILLLAATAYVVWCVVQPMLPYVLVGLGLVWLYGFLIYRRRW